VVMKRLLIVILIVAVVCSSQAQDTTFIKTDSKKFQIVDGAIDQDGNFCILNNRYDNYSLIGFNQLKQPIDTFNITGASNIRIRGLNIYKGLINLVFEKIDIYSDQVVEDFLIIDVNNEKDNSISEIISRDDNQKILSTFFIKNKYYELVIDRRDKSLICTEFTNGKKTDRFTNTIDKKRLRKINNLELSFVKSDLQLNHRQNQPNLDRIFPFKDGFGFIVEGYLYYINKEASVTSTNKLPVEEDIQSYYIKDDYIFVSLKQNLEHSFYVLDSELKIIDKIHLDVWKDSKYALMKSSYYSNFELNQKKSEKIRIDGNVRKLYNGVLANNNHLEVSVKDSVFQIMVASLWRPSYPSSYGQGGTYTATYSGHLQINHFYGYWGTDTGFDYHNSSNFAQNNIELIDYKIIKNEDIRYEQYLTSDKILPLFNNYNKYILVVLDKKELQLIDYSSEF